jgi:hypothetical protein
MKKHFLFLSLLFSLALLSTSCKNENGDSSLFPDESVPPVIATNSTTENFSYSITAVRYTKQEVYNLQIVSDTIKYSFATTSLTGGQMEVIIELKDGTKLITRTISGVIASNDNKKIKSPLSKVTLNYSNFTGQFAMSINNVL